MDAIYRSLVSSLKSSIAGKQQLLANEEQLGAYSDAVSLVIQAYRNGGRLYVAGNGGSASDAQHLAAELVGRLWDPRGPLPAEALCADSVAITALANDYGFENIFARQLECKATSRDVFLALSTSGTSRNILRALVQCRVMHIPSILFTGRGGGRARQLADISVIVPGDRSGEIQELHMVLYHSMVASIESALIGSGSSRDSRPSPDASPAARRFDAADEAGHCVR